MRDSRYTRTVSTARVALKQWVKSIRRYLTRTHYYFYIPQDASPAFLRRTLLRIERLLRTGHQVSGTFGQSLEPATGCRCMFCPLAGKQEVSVSQMPGESDTASRQKVCHPAFAQSHISPEIQMVSSGHVITAGLS